MGLSKGAKSVSFCAVNENTDPAAGRPSLFQPVYSKARTYVFHIRLFTAMRLCIKVLPVSLCTLYALLTITAPAWAFWAVVGILVSLTIYALLIIVSYAVAMNLKCDRCGKPPTIGPKKKIRLKQEITHNVQKMNSPLVPGQWKEKAFRCVHCGAQFALE